jgi:hypothetical protein
MNDLPRQWPLTSAQAAFSVFGHEIYYQYFHWQTSIDNPETFHYYGNYRERLQGDFAEIGTGGLPTPFVYRVFMNWLRVQGDLYQPHSEPVTSLKVATTCRHPIHPSNTASSVKVCPVCVMRQCIEALTRVWKTWEILGAPHRKISVPEDEGIYFKVKDLWRVEKMRWSNLVARYEELGKSEEAWEDLGMQNGEYTFDELNGVQSCRAAVQIAWTMYPRDLAGYSDFFKTGQPLTRRGQGSSLPDPVMPSFCSDPLFAPPPRIPSPPPSPFQWEIVSQDGTSSMPLDIEELDSPPSPPVELTEMSSVLNDSSFPVLESLEDERSSSAEYVPSRTSQDTFSPIASLPASLVTRKKQVAFAEDVMELERRDLSEFCRATSNYSRGRHACPSREGWADTSFKGDIQYWERGLTDEVKLHDGDLGRPYAQLLDNLKLGVDQSLPSLEYDTDSYSGSDSEGDDGSESSGEPMPDIDPALSAVGAGDGTVDNTPDRRTWRQQLPFVAQAASKISHVEAESPSEPGSDFGEDEDEEVNAETRLPDADEQFSDVDSFVSYTEGDMPKTESLLEQDPEAGDIGLSAPIRRDREFFEGELPINDDREIKRQRR